MNHQSQTQAPDARVAPATAGLSNSSLGLTSYMRIAGALAVVASGVIYMMQGLHSVDTEIRYWIYIALMLALGAGGLFSYRLMQDTKGARVFFALAAVLVPVQFAQLGGMILGAVGSGVGGVATSAIAQPSATLLVVIGGLSLSVAAVVSWLSFSILARPFARPLTSGYIALNVLLLLPLRDLPLGLISIGLIGALVFTLEVKLFTRNGIFATLEGAATRAMCILPLAISLVRAAFYQDGWLGYSVMTGIAALCLMLFTRLCCKPGGLRELLGLIAFVAGGGASLGLCKAVLPVSGLNDGLVALCYASPLIIWALAAGQISRDLKALYHFSVLAVGLLLTLAIIPDAESTALLIFTLLGCSLVAWGAACRAKIPLVAGAIIASAGLALMLFTSITQLSGNIWLYLAMVGVLFVGLSSVLEKHGRRWSNIGRENIRHISGWDY